MTVKFITILCLRMNKLIETWKAASDRYIVLPEERQRETSSGLKTTKVGMGDDNQQIGTIVSVGPGRYSEYGGTLIPMQFTVGERIMFKRHAGDTVFIDEDGTIRPGVGDKRDDWLTVTILRQEAIICSL